MSRCVQTENVPTGRDTALYVTAKERSASIQNADTLTYQRPNSVVSSIQHQLAHDSQ